MIGKTTINIEMGDIGYLVYKVNHIIKHLVSVFKRTLIALANKQ